jgi:hypothetical protein
MAGGFGGSGFGGFPLGFGGPISIVRALAVAGQVVRVVYSEEPLHRSAAGALDALNLSNYIFSVPGANATAPTPVGVNPSMVIGPTYGVGNGTGSAAERGFDVAVDRQLIAGVTYLVTVRDVVSAAGGALGSPVSGDFGGVTRLEETRLPMRNQDLVDFACPPSVGHYQVDDSGDIASATPADGTICRVFRRLTTKKDAFRFLRGYGVGLEHKGVASTASLSAMKNDGTAQVKLEPDVAAAAVAVTVQAAGIVLVQARVQTRRGTFVDVGAKVSPAGVSFSP